MRRLLLVLALLLGTPAARADDPPGEPEVPAPTDAADAERKVEGWIRDLASDEFEVRERARKAIQRWGEMARETLLAHRDDADAEVRQAVRAALEKQAPVEAEPPRPTGDLSKLGLVTLSVRGDAASALEGLARLHGARIVVPADSPPVAIEVADAPFFSVLESLAAAAGLDAGGTFDAAGVLELARAAGTPPGPVWAASGPFRLRPFRVTRTRHLVKEGERSYAVTLALQWTPGVELVTYRPLRAVRAEDADGRAYQTPKGEGNVTYGVGQGTPAADLTLNLAPAVPDAEEHLAVLEVALPARVRHGKRSVRFDATAELPVTVDASGAPADEGADRTWTLRSIVLPPREREPLTLEVTARLPGEVASRSARAFLEAADGTRVPLLVTARSTGADGVLRMTGRVYGTSASVVPAGLVVSWFDAEEEGEARFSMKDVPLR